MLLQLAEHRLKFHCHFPQLTECCFNTLPPLTWSLVLLPELSRKVTLSKLPMHHILYIMSIIIFNIWQRLTGGNSFNKGGAPLYQTTLGQNQTPVCCFKSQYSFLWGKQLNIFLYRGNTAVFLKVSSVCPKGHSTAFAFEMCCFPNMIILCHEIGSPGKYPHSKLFLNSHYSKFLWSNNV